MTELADKNGQIAMFMEISGMDYESANLTLSIHNYNLEQAINFHLERPLDPIADHQNTSSTQTTQASTTVATTTSIGSGGSSSSHRNNGTSSDSNSSSASTSKQSESIPLIPIDDDDNVRAPIPPKREQMIMPNEDNFRFRKRRAVHARNVCPLRNFELEGRLQEQRIQAAVFRNFATGSLGDGNEIEHLASIPIIPTQKAATAIPDDDVDDDDVINQTYPYRKNGNNSLGQGGMPSRLSDLYRPPIDISFCGSFQAARDYAKDQNRWLIVNVQDNSDFNCQVLNRDTWSNEKLREILKRYFVFWQVAIDGSDGLRFQVFYEIKVFPYVGIIDPRTGEEKLSHKTGFKCSVNEFMRELQEYLKANTAHPNLELAVSENRLIDGIDFINVKSSKVSQRVAGNKVDDSPQKNKRRKLTMEPSTLSEQQQIALAISNSLKEIASNGGADKSDSSDIDDDDDVDDDDGVEDDVDDDNDEDNVEFDEDTTGNNSDTERVVSIEKTSKSVNLVAEIKVLKETYETHLGSESDPKARIQLRLPNGDRNILEWPCSSTLKALKLYIPFKYPEITTDNPYKVICPFGGIGGSNVVGQPSNILDMDDSLTLKEANLFPTVILHLRNDE